MEEENCHVPYLVKIKRKTKLIPGTVAFQNEVYTNLEVLYREFLPIAYRPLFNKHLHEMMVILCCYYIFYLFEVLTYILLFYHKIRFQASLDISRKSTLLIETKNILCIRCYTFSMNLSCLVQTFAYIVISLLQFQFWTQKIRLQWTT